MIIFIIEKHKIGYNSGGKFVLYVNDNIQYMSLLRVTIQVTIWQGLINLLPMHQNVCYMSFDVLPLTSVDLPIH